MNIYNPPAITQIPGLSSRLTTDSYFIVRSFGSYNDTPMGVDSTSYTAAALVLGCFIDLSLFPATHFRILVRGSSNEAAQTITGALRDVADNGFAHAGGDDVVITNSAGNFDSGWRSRDDSKTGLVYYNVALKGSNATVDLNLRFLEVHWKIDP